jgi:hypothetical protein
LTVLLLAPLACDGPPPPNAAACDAPAIAPSRGACFTGQGCNPVTAEPCGGLACDRIGEGDVFECVDSSLVCSQPSMEVWCQEGTDFVGLCDSCRNESKFGPYCGPTLGCLTSGECARYCCDDGDCGSGHCDTHGVGGGVGVCFQ